MAHADLILAESDDDLAHPGKLLRLPEDEPGLLPHLPGCRRMEVFTLFGDPTWQVPRSVASGALTVADQKESIIALDDCTHS